MDCENTQEQLMDYVEGNLEETRRKEIKQHLAECDGCKKEMKELQQIIAALDSESDSIQIPEDFMSNVRKVVSNTQESRRKKSKHRATMGIVATLFLTLFVGTAVATNSFTNFMDWWIDIGNKQEEQMQSYVQDGLGEYLNLISESNGVKLTITSVVADDIQTLIYYEIEDQQKDNNYMINYIEGLQITNQDEIWERKDEPSYSPVSSHLSIYSKSDRVYKGRLGAAPISTDEGTIQLKLSKLEKVSNTSSAIEGSQNTPVETNEFIEGDWHFDIPVKKHPAIVHEFEVETNEFIEGDWHFDIPVKKHPAIVHEFEVETEIDGNPVVFDKLTIAPTITVLSYRYRNENPDRKIRYLTIASLESEGKHVYDQPDLVGYGGGGGSANGWNSEETTFESLYFEKPTDVRIHIGSASFSVEEQAQFAIDTSKKLPQTFEYLGNKISIEKIEVGERTKIEMIEELYPGRAYENFDYHFYDKDGRGSSGSRVDGYLIDKNGEKYKVSENVYRLNELERPRKYSTERYSVTSFYDDIIEISLD